MKIEKIQDGSLDDINCPWLISTDFKSEDNVVKVEFKNEYTSRDMAVANPFECNVT